MTLRICMWSGPRNISTAMMRSFSSRPDCAVSDEPFYGCFLKESGAPHPMAAEVIADMDCDWHSVTAALSGPAPAGQPVWYQKHMTHHMVGPVQPDDLVNCIHAFLIREPARMVASYRNKRESVTPEDLGYATQRAFFDRIADRLGHAPPVVDSADVLADPAGTLTALCTALGIPWNPAMLAWPSGIHPDDGIWASHWYDAVAASSGFQKPDDRPITLDEQAAVVADACQPDYQHLARHRIRADAI
ncbi:HAD family hydrolase [Sphingomonas lacunae]|uniref:HAD family hydrolase n=1 Tax=Sphingomonas lacunae TaxID=2698828 RepID=A0A6M4B161_9SPHN|nr:HAD family hydrolase [Sphingomonas lacunae]QJQ33111.1 HAD family hydrolase [Sphingomonas lacunae]